MGRRKAFQTDQERIMTRRSGFGVRFGFVGIVLACLPAYAGAQEVADPVPPAPEAAQAAPAPDAQALEASVEALRAEVDALRGRVEAAEARPAGAAKPGMRFETHVQLHNLLVFRNDTDFDRSRPLYDENGQTAGVLATVFGPTLTWHLTKDVRVFYEAEVGLNYWSKNNPDQENPLALDIFVLKHRQIFAEGELAGGRFGFKVGYQYFTDTTAMFLGHWIGAVQGWYQWAPGRRAGLFFGMVPDSTFEGLDIRMNNFRHDILVFGGRTDLEFGPHWSFAAAVHAMHDSHIVGRPRWLVAPNFRLQGRTGWLRDGGVRVTGTLDGVVQAGRSGNSALDGGDQTLLAWAAQGNLKIETRPLAIALNVLALSPDDATLGNGREGGFFYSSKSTSATVFFTEDEVRNWYDQLDRRMGRYEGGFWQHRAGMLLSDVKLTLQTVPWFRPSVVLGYGIVLEPENALGERNLGFEGNLDLAFLWGEHLVARLMVGGMQPGKAAGGLLNQIAPQKKATDGMWWTEAALSLVF